MHKSWGITRRAVGVSPPSCPHLTRRAYAAPLAGFAATGDVTPLIVNPAIMPFNLCTGAYLMDAVIEPERLVQISLGQENLRMRMNAAPGSLKTHQSERNLAMDRSNRTEARRRR